MMRWKLLLASALFWTLNLSPVFAVHPQTWTETNQEEFLQGSAKNVAVSSLGELVLTRAHQELLSEKDDVQVVYALAEISDGRLLAATGPKGQLFEISPLGKPKVLFTREEDPLLLSLLPLADGRVLIGTGGKEARILALSPEGKVSVFAALADTNHVWALAADKAGNVYATTGPNGQLFKLSPEGKATKLFTADQPNLISLAVAPEGTVYVGTDQDGLIYRLGPDGKPFVLYNAAEPDIVALTFDAKGRLLAATSGVEGSGGGMHESSQLSVEIKAQQKNASQPSPPEGEEKADIEGDSSEPGETSASQPLHGMGRHEDKLKPPGKADDIKQKGPTVYLIDAHGFVNELHRFDTPLQCLACVGEEIWVGTGQDGRLDVLRPANDEHLAYAQLPCDQITALLVRKNGSVAVATANSGQVFEFGPALATEGKFTSKAFDAEQVVAFGRVDFDLLAPEGASVTLSTRSGNMAEPSDDLWSGWSAQKTSGQPADSPSARFLQYRLTLKADPKGRGPTVTEVRAIYQAANRHPVISDFKSASEEEPSEPQGKDHKEAMKQAPSSPKVADLVWTGSDPNHDELTYSLFFRPIGSGTWVSLKDRLAESKFTWDITSVPDGRYEVRVIASDAPDNAPGTELTHTFVSRPISVDNTAPIVTIEPVKIEGAKCGVKANINDNLSRIVSVHFALDSQDQWRAASASDGMFDSPQEGASFELSNLTKGPHYLVVKAADAAGNVGFGRVELTIP